LDAPVTAEDPKDSANYRFLRAVVIILGGLIVMAVIALAVGFATRFGGHASGGAAPQAPSLTLAPGARILSVDVASNRLVLHVRSQDGEEVDIIDTETGRLVSQIKAPAKTGRE
jgi:hypothetical protein